MAQYRLMIKRQGSESWGVLSTPDKGDNEAQQLKYLEAQRQQWFYNGTAEYARAAYRIEESDYTKNGHTGWVEYHPPVVLAA